MIGLNLDHYTVGDDVYKWEYGAKYWKRCSKQNIHSSRYTKYIKLLIGWWNPRVRYITKTFFGLKNIVKFIIVNKIKCYLYTLF